MSRLSNDVPLRASLLGLPSELRLQIYDYVLQASVDCRIIDDVVHTSDSRGTQATLLPNLTANLSSNILWLNLLVVCRSIAGELRSYINESFCSNNDNRTYVLDLQVYNEYPATKATRTVTWRHIPCPPHLAQRVVMNVITKRGPGPWTDGGSASLGRALYQVLNHTTHRGPRIFRQSLLQTHMELQEVLINIDIGTTCDPPTRGCNTDPMWNWKYFQDGWRQVAQTGFFEDYLEKTRLKRHDDGMVVEILSEYQKLPALPGYWRGLGFQWGTTGLQCARYLTLATAPDRLQGPLEDAEVQSMLQGQGVVTIAEEDADGSYTPL